MKNVYKSIEKIGLRIFFYKINDDIIIQVVLFNILCKIISSGMYKCELFHNLLFMKWYS